MGEEISVKTTGKDEIPKYIRNRRMNNGGDKEAEIEKDGDGESKEDMSDE